MSEYITAVNYQQQNIVIVTYKDTYLTKKNQKFADISWSIYLL